MLFQNFQHLRFPKNSKTSPSVPVRPDEREEELKCTCDAGKKKKKKKKDTEEPDDRHLVSCCLVVLGLFGYLPNGKCIPVTINQFRNSHLGIIPLSYQVGSPNLMISYSNLSICLKNI